MTFPVLRRSVASINATRHSPSIQTLETAKSQEIAKSFARTKKLVPTRAHPNAPDKPPYETLAGFLALPMDKVRLSRPARCPSCGMLTLNHAQIRDVFNSWPDEEELSAAENKYEQQGGRDALHKVQNAKTAAEL